MQCLLNAKHCAEYFSENYVSFRELRKLMVEAPGVRLRLPGLGMGRRPRSLWGKSPLPRAQSEGSCLVERHRTMHYILTVPPPGLTDSSSQRMKIIRHLQQWCQAGGHALGPGNNSTLSSCHHCNKVSGSHSRGSQSCVCPHACTCTHTILWDTWIYLGVVWGVLSLPQERERQNWRSSLLWLWTVNKQEDSLHGIKDLYGSVFISHCCCNKLPQIYYLTIFF